MLIGNYEGVLGKKRRIAIPKKFREVLGADCIIAKWYENCLVLVSKENWKNLIDRVTGDKRMVIEAVRNIDRFIMGSAYELEGDDQGRVIIPANLAEFANLKEEVIFLGLGDRVEIWNKADWEKNEKEMAEKASEFMEKLGRENA